MKSYLRSFMNGESARQFATMSVIGVVNTFVDFGLVNVLFPLGVNVYLSVTIAFVVASIVSYLLNRRYTFGLGAGGANASEGTGFLIVNVVALGVTQAVVWVAAAWFGPLDQLTLNLAKLASTVIILVPKFAGYRDLVFRRALRDRA
jgi:putative flippase GtrA